MTDNKYDKTSDAISKLSEEQYYVTQNNGTEIPFGNKYWDNKEEGIYVDIVSGEPLFSSKEKYDSGTGWPSFYDTINKNNIIELTDKKLAVTRTEVRSKNADSHLGHVFFNENTKTGLRYCINSASLRFIPKDSLIDEGYSEFYKLFNKEDNK